MARREIGEDTNLNYMGTESLSSFLHLDRLDIGRLTIENPKSEKELPFDAREEITQEDWDKMIEALDTHRQGKNWLGFIYLARAMLFVFPERRDELNLDEQVWKGMKQELEYNKIQHYFRFVSHAVDMWQLFPNRQSELDLTDQDFEKMKQTFEEFYNTENAKNSCAFYLIFMKTLFPNQSLDLGLTDQAWKEIDDCLERYRSNDQIRFCELAVKMKLLQRDVKLDDQDWGALRQMLEKNRTENSWGNFAYHSMEMQILAADEAMITPQGELEIVMRKPKDFNQPKPPMPVVRKF